MRILNSSHLKNDLISHINLVLLFGGIVPYIPSRLVDKSRIYGLKEEKGRVSLGG